jgi:hypothetical protein
MVLSIRWLVHNEKFDAPFQAGHDSYSRKALELEIKKQNAQINNYCLQIGISFSNLHTLETHAVVSRTVHSDALSKYPRAMKSRR